MIGLTYKSALILTCLHDDDLVTVARLLGKPVQRVPYAGPPRYPLPVKQLADTSPRVTSVAPNPRKEGSSAYKMYALLQPGRSVQQYLLMGGTPRILAEARRHGHVRLDDSCR